MIAKMSAAPTTPPCKRRWVRCLLIIALASGIATVLAEEQPRANTMDEAQIARGQSIYKERCASCHGANLEGHPDWKRRLPSGRMPPPPHDANGHTWHHPDELLFGMIQRGVAAYAWKGYESDMPAFGSILSDEEIWSVLDFLKSTWPNEIRASQADRTEQARRQAASKKLSGDKKQ